MVLQTGVVKGHSDTFCEHDGPITLAAGTVAQQGGRGT